jgi:hypothetical protein
MPGVRRMIYGKVRAQIDDPEYGSVHVTVTHDPVSIKQGLDLIRLSRPAARELAGDLHLCLDELEGKNRGDAFWTTERRAMLRGAIAKVKAGAEKRKAVPLTREESTVMLAAAEKWADTMDMLDRANDAHLHVAAPSPES